MLTDQNICQLLSVASPSFYLSQSLIIKAEVMGYFVAHHFPYLCFNFVARATLCLYRPLEYAYFVGQDQAIPAPSPDLRHALIKAKQLLGIPCFSLSQLSLCGPLLYHDINVLKLALKFQGQTRDCSAYQTFELFSIHSERIQILPIRVKNDRFYGSTEPY